MPIQPTNHKYVPTPSPLRKNADPVDWHVMPSRKSSSANNQEKSKTVNQTVLNEDDYKKNLSILINKKYFPETDKYRAHLSVYPINNNLVLAGNRIRKLWQSI